MFIEYLWSGKRKKKLFSSKTVSPALCAGIYSQIMTATKRTEITPQGSTKRNQKGKRKEQVLCICFLLQRQIYCGLTQNGQSKSNKLVAKENSKMNAVTPYKWLWWKMYLLNCRTSKQFTREISDVLSKKGRSLHPELLIVTQIAVFRFFFRLVVNKTTNCTPVNLALELTSLC